MENACVAIECARALGLSDEHIRFGVEHAKNPARLEKLSENPTVIYDGAHNPDGVSALIHAMDRYFHASLARSYLPACGIRITWILCRLLARADVSHFIFTTVSGNERAMPCGCIGG